MKRYAVIDCEDHPKWEGHPRLWIEPLRRSGARWQSYRAWAHELPTAPRALDGVVVTGSHESAADDTLPWLEPLLDLLRETVEAGVPTFGACFGAQALARALGGTVGPNPTGEFVFGAESMSVDERAGGGLWPREEKIPHTLRLLQSHGDCVREPPPAARIVASSASCECEIFSVGSNALGVQAHPEASPELLQNKILPFLLEDGRLSDRGASEAIRGMQQPLDSARMLDAIERFLYAE